MFLYERCYTNYIQIIIIRATGQSHRTPSTVILWIFSYYYSSSGLISIR